MKVIELSWMAALKGRLTKGICYESTKRSLHQLLADWVWVEGGVCGSWDWKRGVSALAVQRDGEFGLRKKANSNGEGSNAWQHWCPVNDSSANALISTQAPAEVDDNSENEGDGDQEGEKEDDEGERGEEEGMYGKGKKAKRKRGGVKLGEGRGLSNDRELTLHVIRLLSDATERIRKTKNAINGIPMPRSSRTIIMAEVTDSIKEMLANYEFTSRSIAILTHRFACLAIAADHLVSGILAWRL